MSVDMIPFTAETVAVQRPAFWSIADDLEAYAETLAMIDAQFDTSKDEDERATLVLERIEIQEHIERLSEALVKKTDDLAGVLRRMKSDIGEQKIEEKRIHARRKASEAALSHLEGYTSSVMNKHGWRHLKTAKNTIALRGNGGVQPLVISDPSMVPDEMCRMEGWVTQELWDLAVDLARTTSKRGTRINDYSLARTPSNSLIREALIQPCARCGGTSRIRVPLNEIPGSALNDGCTEMTELCPSCAGTGSARVPGCSLAPRGERLEVR